MTDLYKEAIKLGVKPKDMHISIQPAERYGEMINKQAADKNIPMETIYANTPLDRAAKSRWIKKGVSANLSTIVAALAYIRDHKG